MNGSQEVTRSRVSRQVHRRRTRRRRRGLSSDQLADCLIETLREAADRGLHPPLLLVTLAGSQIMVCRYDQIGDDAAGAVLFERLDREDVFAFPVRIYVTDALDQVLYATRAAAHSPTSFQITRATHFGGRHGS